jgi:hypothetical protein
MQWRYLHVVASLDEGAGLLQRPVWTAGVLLLLDATGAGKVRACALRLFSRQPVGITTYMTLSSLWSYKTAGSLGKGLLNITAL